MGTGAEKERDYLGWLPPRYPKLAERSMNKEKDQKEEAMSFSWINGRKVRI
jgi:hypothetical protein